MSTNFTGVTFAQQKVLPSDDAIIRRAILPDGILYGCELSYSGSTLTLAAGQLLICGRQIRHPSSQNWAVVDATSGYARLLLTVDMTRTSTKEVFEQVVDSIEYASAEDGFPNLDQTDINISGSRYQVVVCVVSLGTGGITGIVSQLGRSVVESSGGLNFSVVGGSTQPSDPKDNMIWVDTENEISGWTFSATEPSGSEGLVWIEVGAYSNAAFNALKKNELMVYPVLCKQYMGGAWSNRKASAYVNGNWVDFSAECVYLFIDGDGELQTFSESNVTVTVDNGIVISFKAGNWGHFWSIWGHVPVDVTPFSKLCMDAEFTRTAANANAFGLGSGIIDASSDIQSYASVAEIALDTASTHFEVDISNVSGEYHWGVWAQGDATNATAGTITKIWLE